MEVIVESGKWIQLLGVVESVAKPIHIQSVYRRSVFESLYHTPRLTGTQSQCCAVENRSDTCLVMRDCGPGEP